MKDATNTCATCRRPIMAVCMSALAALLEGAGDGRRIKVVLHDLRFSVGFFHREGYGFRA